MAAFYTRAHLACDNRFALEANDRQSPRAPGDNRRTREERLFGIPGLEISPHQVVFERKDNQSVIRFRNLSEEDFLLLRKVMGYLGLGYRTARIDEKETDSN